MLLKGLLKKPTLPNSNSTWNAQTRLNKSLELFGASWVNKLQVSADQVNNCLKSNTQFTMVQISQPFFPL